MTIARDLFKTMIFKEFLKIEAGCLIIKEYALMFMYYKRHRHNQRHRAIDLHGREYMAKMLNRPFPENIVITVLDDQFEVLVELDPGLEGKASIYKNATGYACIVGGKTLKFTDIPIFIPGTLRATYTKSSGILCIHALRSPAGIF
jgi:hypothetical protein